VTAATPGQAAGLLDPLHALAAKWDANAARNQRNGQSLIDQGDEYGSEGLAVAEALGACVVDLRAVLADAAPEPHAAIEQAAYEADIASLTGQRNRVSETADQLRAQVSNLRDALERCRDAAGQSPAAVHTIASQALASSPLPGGDL
jgi:hypothetical protein